MYVCRRCVCLLRSSSALLWGKAPGLAGAAAGASDLYSVSTAVSLHSAASHQIFFPSPRERWWSWGVRFFSDQQPVTQTEGSIRAAGSEEHQEPGEAVAVTVAQNMIDLDKVPYLSPFEEISEEDAVKITVPSLLPPASFTLRDYVDESETLSNLVELGVNLSKLEQRPNVGSMLLRLDFQADVAPRLVFLKNLGVKDTLLESLLTKNPFILTESLENLQARVSYLRSKNFSLESIAAMASKAPYLLNFSVKRLDNRLGFFQQQLGLSPGKTKNVVTRLPRLLCGSLEPIKENLKVCQLEFGFQKTEIQHIVIKVPKVLTAGKRKLTHVFDFVHNTMGVPHSLIAKFPQVLNTNFLRIKERHMFLEFLGRTHYDPAHPNYISLERLVCLPDTNFCTEVALASLEDFERFQKTL